MYLDNREEYACGGVLVRWKMNMSEELPSLPSVAAVGRLANSSTP